VRLGAGVQEPHGQIQVISLETLNATTSVSEAERRVLRSGGMLVLDPNLKQGGFVEFVAGRTNVGTAEQPMAMPVVTGLQRVPAAVIDPNTWQSALADGQFGAWVLPATATKLGWPVTLTYLEATSPTGMISSATQTAVNDRLGGENTMQVERGFQNAAWLIMLILFSAAGSLVLIASLISTALSLAESQNDMATLAAVGATRHTRTSHCGQPGMGCRGMRLPAWCCGRDDPRNCHHLATHDAGCGPGQPGSRSRSPPSSSYPGCPSWRSVSGCHCWPPGSRGSRSVVIPR